MPTALRRLKIRVGEIAVAKVYSNWTHGNGFWLYDGDATDIVQTYERAGNANGVVSTSPLSVEEESCDQAESLIWAQLQVKMISVYN